MIHVELQEANDFVALYHRHHRPVAGHRFSIGCTDSNVLVGVAIVGRPVARLTDQKRVVEITRLCTNGTKNACSFLYSAAARAASALGYQMIQTFILESELGTSLKAAGWSKIAESGGGSWTRKSKPNRRQDQPMVPKQKWARKL